MLSFQAEAQWPAGSGSLPVLDCAAAEPSSASISTRLSEPGAMLLTKRVA